MVEVPRGVTFWLTAVSVMILCIVNGIQYVFGLFAPEIKESLSYTQAEINLLFSCLYIGSNILLVPFSIFLQSFKIHRMLLCSAFLGTLMWILVMLSVDKKIPSSIVSMTFYFLFLGLSMGAYFICALVAMGPDVIPKSIYIVLSGVLVTGYGLGGAIFTAIYQAFFIGQLPEFLLAVSIASFVSGIWAAGQVYYWRKGLEGRRIDGYEVIGDGKLTDPRKKDVLDDDAASVMGDDTRMRSGTEVKRREEEFFANKNGQNGGDESSNLLEENGKNYQEGIVTSNNSLLNKLPVTVFQRVGMVSLAIMKTPTFYLLCFMMISYTGIGATYAGNLGSMVNSLGRDEDVIIDMELIFSIAQVVGRIIFTILNSVKTPFHRAYLLVALNLCLGLICLINYGVANFTILPYAIAGVAMFYGAGWCLLPSALLFLPHPEEISISWSLVAVSGGIGPLVVGQVVGRLYDSKAPEDSIYCDGEHCFQNGNLFMGILGLIAAACGLLFRYLIRNQEAPKDSEAIVGH